MMLVTVSAALTDSVGRMSTRSISSKRAMCHSPLYQFSVFDCLLMLWSILLMKWILLIQVKHSHRCLLLKAPLRNYNMKLE